MNTHLIKQSLVWPLLALTVLTTSCQQQDGNERLKEKAALEGEETARKQIEAEKKYQEDRALEMEGDLARRQRFYAAVSGVFEGTMKDSVTKETLKVRFTFTPSLPPYKSDRVRAWDEIVQDLNNLYFNVQVIQWTDGGNNPDIAFGCVFQNIRPDLQTGQVPLASSDCASVYQLYLSDDGTIPFGDFTPVRENSAHISGTILDDGQDEVGFLKGMRQVTKSSAIFKLAVKRKNP